VSVVQFYLSRIGAEAIDVEHRADSRRSVQQRALRSA
jgi:hypothetical protein